MTDVIAYVPKFGFTKPVVASLLRLATAQSTIDNAVILPAQDEVMRVSTMAETIHYSTLLEGNRLTEVEARRAVAGALDAKTKAEIELVNYVDALEHVEQQARTGGISYDVAFLLGMHGRITKGLGRDGTSFESHHEGAWRDHEASVISGGVIEHTGVPRDELERRLDGFLEYLRARHGEDEFPGAVLAGIAHHALTDFHPFADGNGRTARALAFAILMNEGVMSRRLYSPDRYYALDKPSYIAALRSSHRAGYSTATWYEPARLDTWLEYYVGGLALEAERIAATTTELARVAGAARQIRLSRHQELLIAEMSAGGRQSVSRAEFSQITGLQNERAAQRELRELVSAGVLSSTGKGASIRYRIGATRGGRWHEESIREALDEFLKGRRDWPSSAEFREAGRQPLYVAMSRHGGIPAWRRKMGFPAADQ